jgi:hypothetical protein
MPDKTLCPENTDEFRFDDIRETHRVMEANQANGKMVVVS